MFYASYENGDKGRIIALAIETHADDVVPFASLFFFFLADESCFFFPLRKLKYYKLNI